MSRRKLSDQQKRTIGDRIQDVLDTPQEQGIVLARYGRAAEVLPQTGGVIHCQIRQNIGEVLAGDQVHWQAEGETGHGSITAILPRHSAVGRSDARGNLKPIAANVHQMVIVAAPKPALISQLLDSYLVLAEHLKLKALLVFNKCDLLSPEARQEAESQLELYSAIGYPVVFTSIVTQVGMDELALALRGQTSIFVGQSGVGKSSLLQAIIPEEAIPIDAFSQPRQRGRHTTTTARYYPLLKGGAVIDSPGIREIVGLWHLSSDAIAQGFIEIKSRLGECKYRNCAHVQEDSCAIRAAVEAGEIHPHRYHNFLKLRG